MSTIAICDQGYDDSGKDKKQQHNEQKSNGTIGGRMSARMVSSSLNAMRQKQKSKKDKSRTKTRTRTGTVSDHKANTGKRSVQEG